MISVCSRISNQPGTRVPGTTLPTVSEPDTFKCGYCMYMYIRELYIIVLPAVHNRTPCCT